MQAEQPDSSPITPQQLRDARALLGLSRNRLAFKSYTTVGFIAAFETSGRTTRFLWRPRDFDGLAALRTALEAAGVEFTNGDQPCVKLVKAVG